MKRNVLLTLAFAASTVAFAQTNLAIGGTATATSKAEDAGLAIDNDEGTRWEASADDCNTNENVEWTLDLGSVQAFNTIQIKWEGAYSKSFVISVSEDGQVYTDVVTKTDETLTDLLQNYSFNEVNAQYIKFRNVERATQWGISFWEFRVFNMEASTLTAIDLISTATVTKVGTPVTLTATGKDQIGQAMEVSNMTFEVTPAEAGTVNEGVFTPAQAGEATIVAKSGDITSNEIKVTAYNGEKIDIFSNMAAMVTPLGESTLTSDMVGAFDDNMNSTWVLYGNSDADEEARTYDTGFTVDLQALYDITALSVTFEGACPEDYTISFAGNDGVYGNEHSVTGHAGMATFTDFFLCGAQEIRYVKFISTKAATQYGIKIFDFTVYGDNKQDIPDSEAPTDFTAEVDADAAAYTSVTLKLQSSDNVSSVVSYEISYGVEGGETETVTTSGASGAEVSYELKGLTQGTTYSLSVVAKDAKGNAAEAVALTAATKAFPAPGAATAPSHSASSVISIYSDSYATADGLGVVFSDWAGNTSGHGETEVADGDKAYYILGFSNIFGIDYGSTIDVSEYDALHIDIWSDNAQTIGISPICGDTQAEPVDVALEAGKWNGIDLQLSVFSTLPLQSNYQIELVNGDGKSLIFVDNVYFYSLKPTGINGINAETSAEDGAIYNLAGQRVSKATKGVFIINGKKVVVK